MGALEDIRRLVRSCVVSDDGLGNSSVRHASPHEFRIDHFVDQDVDVMTFVDQVLAGASVPGKANRVSPEIQPVAVRRLDRAMIHKERSDPNRVRRIDGAFSDVMRDDLNAGRRVVLIDVSPHMDIERKGLL